MGASGLSIAVVSRVGYRGILPALPPKKSAETVNFYYVIDHERFIALFAEG